MNILVTGSSGFVGSAVVFQLSSKGHLVKTLVRRDPKHPYEIRWNPPQSGPTPEQLQGIDAVIHLAGESIADNRWTETKKKAIKDSRMLGTKILADAVSRMPVPPKVMISASAIGYYGDRGTEALKEDSPAGRGFLPEVCQAWETATAPAIQKGVRVVQLRFGLILSVKGGALAKMLPPFKMGLGGVLGSGVQYMSWIALEDALGVINYALFGDTIFGAHQCGGSPGRHECGIYQNAGARSVASDPLSFARRSRPGSPSARWRTPFFYAARAWNRRI